MRIGIMVGEITGAASLDQLIGQVQTAADAGLDTAWQAQMIGPGADALADAVLATLSGHHLPPGSYLVKRYGDPGAPERHVSL